MNEKLTRIRKILKDNLKIVIPILSLIIIGIIYLSIFNYKTYDFSKLYNIKINGYSGYATLEIETNYIDEDIDLLLEKSELSISKTTEISNGDVINVKISYPNDLAKRLKIKIPTEFEYTVSGLEEANALDLFKDIKINYGNKSPYITVDVTNDNELLKDYNVRYTVKIKDSDDYYKVKRNLFANGDTITITATFDNEKITNDGYFVIVDSKEVKIENQDKFIESTSEITDDMFEKINTEMIKEIENIEPEKIRRNYCGWYYCAREIEDIKYKVDTVELKKMYLGYKTNVRTKEDFDDFGHTSIIGIYKFTFEGDRSAINPNKERYMYCAIWYDNMYLKNDGSLSDYTKADYHLDCDNTSIPGESTIKNNYNSGKYQYRELLSTK